MRKTRRRAGGGNSPAGPPELPAKRPQANCPKQKERTHCTRRTGGAHSRAPDVPAPRHARRPAAMAKRSGGVTAKATLTRQRRTASPRSGAAASPRDDDVRQSGRNRSVRFELLEGERNDGERGAGVPAGRLLEGALFTICAVPVVGSAYGWSLVRPLVTGSYTSMVGMQALYRTDIGCCGLWRVRGGVSKLGNARLAPSLLG